jgi:CHAT domain-containing protein
MGDDTCRGTFEDELAEASAGPAGFDLAAAHALYQNLLGPIADRLAGKRHLIIVPDPQLSGFPFHLLVSQPPDPALEGAAAYRTAHWLIRDHAISVLPTVSSLRALRELPPRTAPAPLPLVGFGDPLIGTGEPMTCPEDSGTLQVASGAGETVVTRSAAGVGAEVLFRSGQMVDGMAVADVDQVRSLQRLPDTRCELEALARSQGAGPEDLFLGAAAREGAVKALSAKGRLADYRVVAFATHGLVAGEAGAAEPALVLTPPAAGTPEDDGLLTAGEVAALQLNADWVVLSACNTAAGDGTPNAENLTGLARAFFYAGAKSLLVSPWPVQSDAAVRLTTTAFAALTADPAQGRAAALRQAMLAMLDHGADRNTHPARWVPFALFGEGGPSLQADR